MEEGRRRRPSGSQAGQHASVTGLVNPFWFDAVQVKIAVPGGCSITRLIDVSVRVGFTPVQLLFGQPATEPLTVGAADNVAGLVVKVRFPFLIALAGIAVFDVAGPTRTLFWPGAVLPPPFWHW